MERQAEHPPIELVAARLRDLRQTALIISASPDLIDGQEELARVTADYDELLVIAAQQVDVGVEGFRADGTGLPSDVRRHLEHAIVAQGWVLDF